MTTTKVLSGESFVADVVDQGHLGRQQLLVVGLCLILNMLDGFDITAMAVVATSVSSELGLTADQLGWIFSFALAGMMAGAMLLAPVSDLIGEWGCLLVINVLLVAAMAFNQYASFFVVLMRYLCICRDGQVIKVGGKKVTRCD